jgi:hypothetical protein
MRKCHARKRQLRLGNIRHPLRRPLNFELLELEYDYSVARLPSAVRAPSIRPWAQDIEARELLDRDCTDSLRARGPY